MATKSRRKRHRILALIAAGAMALVVALIVAVVWIMIRQPDKPDTAVPPTAVPPTACRPTPGTKPRPEFQDASCPDVQLMSIPGTWESSPQLDPFNPTQFPIALLLNVTNPIRAAVRHRPAARCTPFPTRRSSTIRSRPTSRCPTTTAAPRAPGNAVKAITDMNNRCPLTSYVIVGFSQGAVIAGDIASDIGNGRGPGRRGPGARRDVDRRRPQADGRRPGHRAEPARPGRRDHPARGADAVGDGADDDRPAPRRLRRAQRPHQRDLRDRRPDLLGAGGGVLDRQPAEDDGDPRRRRGPARARACTPRTQFWNLDGQPATAWTLDWAQKVVDNAPHPKHG